MEPENWESHFRLLYKTDSQKRLETRYHCAGKRFCFAVLMLTFSKSPTKQQTTKKHDQTIGKGTKYVTDFLKTVKYILQEQTPPMKFSKLKT